MRKFIGKRILIALVTVFVLATLTFFLMKLIREIRFRVRMSAHMFRNCSDSIMDWINRFMNSILFI